MLSLVYEGNKLCNIGSNRPNSCRDVRVKNGDLVVPVNNALVCCASFMAADTQPCVLIHVPKNDVQIASLKNLINSTYNVMLAIVF